MIALLLLLLLPAFLLVAPKQNKKEVDSDWVKSLRSSIFFIASFVQILAKENEGDTGRWIPFSLWSPQARLLKTLNTSKRVLILKARQLGFTTLVLAYILWKMVCFPNTAVGLFSKGEMEAIELLARLKEMFLRLPPKFRYATERNDAHLFKLKNGSWARAMSTKQGESFTFSILFMDEFGRFDYAETLMRNVEPAADKAQIIVGSIVDNEKPDSIFCNMIRAVLAGTSKWLLIFWPWWYRPGRDQAWYQETYRDRLSKHGGDEAGAMDDMNMQYPGTVEDALAPRMQNKRIPYAIIKNVYVPTTPLTEAEMPDGRPDIPGLKVYKLPEVGQRCVLGGDPAEGVVGSDDSAVCILDDDTGEELAAFEGKFEPTKVFPGFLFNLAVWYNDARVLIERNNHGHATIAEVRELVAVAQGCTVEVLCDPVDERYGWLNSTRRKAEMYDLGARQVRDRLVLFHDKKGVEQLASIDINTLRAPQGYLDDCATARMLACVARTIKPRTVEGKVFV